jgi:hypothetical protein
MRRLLLTHSGHPGDAAFACQVFLLSDASTAMEPHRMRCGELVSESSCP